MCFRVERQFDYCFSTLNFSKIWQIENFYRFYSVCLLWSLLRKHTYLFCQKVKYGGMRLSIGTRGQTRQAFIR